MMSSINIHTAWMLPFWKALLASLGMSASINAATPRFEARYDATDQGPIIRHGDGPDSCDARGMREPSIVQQDGKYYLFYDGCAAPGWSPMAHRSPGTTCGWWR